MRMGQTNVFVWLEAAERAEQVVWIGTEAALQPTWHRVKSHG